MKYCGKCGVQMNDEAQFCGNCGAGNDVPETVRGDINQTPSFSNARQAKDKTGAGNKVKIAALIVLVLALMGGSVWGWSYYNKQGGKPNNAPQPTSTSEAANQAAGQPAPAKVESSFGNTQGNLCNWGLACQKGGWMYYSTEDGKIYRSRLDGSEKQVIVNDARFKMNRSINVVDNWVFFVPGNGPLFRVDTDGKNLKMMEGPPSITLVQTYKDWIYFVGRSGGAEANLYRMKTDGSNLQPLDKAPFVGGYECLQLTEEWVYFSVGEYEKPDKLYRMRLDGSAKSEIEGIEPAQFSIVGDWLYTCGYGGVCRTNMQSKVREILCDADFVVFLNPSDGWIYYCNRNERNLADTGVYRMRLDGSAREKVNSEQAGMINIVGDWIYYANMAKDSEGLTRIHIDGSGKEKLS